jgi:L-threonylcarbamoyladenylate synthase
MDNAQVEQAARSLAAGELVAFATETVYGLGADATNPAALAKIFALKGRPADHPLIVHIADASQLDRFARDVPPGARALARAFWPGPLTMIVPRSDAVPREATGGQDSVGLRCPSHPLAQALLRAFAQVGSGAIAAPSANKFGHVSPTTAQHVRDEFGPGLTILDGGACEVGLESTIVDLTRGHPVLLRPGAIGREDIARVVGEAPASADAQAPRASGTLASHYAPRTPLVLMEARRFADELHVGDAVLALRAPPAHRAATAWIEAPGDPVRYGHDLYRNLRELDGHRATRILVEAPPREASWEAVNDRLGRAAAGSAEENDAP